MPPLLPWVSCCSLSFYSVSCQVCFAGLQLPCLPGLLLPYLCQGMKATTQFLISGKTFQSTVCPHLSFNTRTKIRWSQDTSATFGFAWPARFCTANILHQGNTFFDLMLHCANHIEQTFGIEYGESFGKIYCAGSLELVTVQVVPFVESGMGHSDHRTYTAHKVKAS